MSRICRNMEDSVKHWFHGLKHDAKMLLFTTPLPCEATKPQGICYSRKTSNEERKTGKRVHNTPANGGIDRRESYHFRRLARETGPEKKGKRELCRNIETTAKCLSAGVEGGRVKHLAGKTPRGRKNVPERVTYEAQVARAEWTSCPTLRGRRRNRADNYQEPPPRKTE